MSVMLSLWKGQVRTPAETTREILQRCAENHGVTVEDIKGTRRTKHIAAARQEAMYRLRDLRAKDGGPRHSFPAIARIIGVCDHTTVMHGVKAHQRRMEALRPHVTWAAE